ncbi:restriction endonuclease [Desulfosediminicola flagellatus]|uniref:restriction endonuclease n=1 Tax=Desulfosediminicola flagellatus TaxID=2569541 RepID=UPI0010AC87E1|nr:restriction endonuclease [Desulfosediminicola flagellatus]
MVSKDKLSKASVVFLSGVIVLVTLMCLVMFHDSPMYLSLLGMLFLLSLVKVAVSASVKSQKETLSSLVFDKLFNTSKPTPKPAAGKKVAKRGDFRSEPVVDMRFDAMPPSLPTLSLDRYLEFSNFTLNDEIMSAIEWKRFELLCHLVIRASGLNSRLTGDGADEGVDIRIYDKENPSKVLYLVQCKKWSKRSKIDRPLLQQLRGQMAAENVAKGGYCITSSFTLPAVEFAASNDIELFDQQKIITTFNAFDKAVRAKILKQLLEGDYWTPSCATCGKKFSATTTRNGKKVWACLGSNGHGWNSISYYEAAPISKVG